MEKKDVLDILKKIDKKITGRNIIASVNKFLSEQKEYNIELLENGIIIKSKIEDLEHGSYIQVTIDYNSKQKTKNIVLIKKEYDPYYENKNGFREKTGLEVSSTVYSYIFNKEDNLLYSSWSSGDNKYLLGEGLSSEMTEKMLLSYFFQTSPTYENGVLVDFPKSSYDPIYNIWERYDNTNVFHEYGRNFFNVEYSKIGITFNNNLIDDIYLLSEVNGEVYSLNNKLNDFDIKTVVSKLDTLYKEYIAGGNFDLDGFLEEYNYAIIKKRVY